MLRNVCEPITMRAAPGAVSQTCGSNSVCSPTSSRPSPKASRTLPCSGQRANARLRASSRWMRARFQGSELRSYQRHFCSQSEASLTARSLSERAAATAHAR